MTRVRRRRAEGAPGARGSRSAPGVSERGTPSPPSPTRPSPAREVAAHVLERVEADAAYPDVLLDQALDGRNLARRDVALATELVYGTLRWQRYLDWILGPHSRRRLESLDARIRVLLRLAAYQIAFLDRVPSFAAVNDAVALAPRTPGVRAFVNAVLRAFARRGAREREPRPPRDPLDALATRCSFPTWIAERWVARFGRDAAEALMRAMNERPPLTLRANLLRVSRDALGARLTAEEGLVWRPARWAPEGLVVVPGGAPGSWGAFAAGNVVVQDEASILVGRLLEPRPGETIADVCAAPGTKTTHLAELMKDRGRVLAFDPQPERLERVREAAARLGLASVELVPGAVEARVPRFRATCDGVLVDAPCSNLGVLRRNPDAKWRRTLADLATNAARQARILEAGAALVKPGGRLVYATCSLEPEENDDVARGFLAAHPEFRPDPPGEFPFPLDPDGVLRCLPHRHGTDGFTAVRFRRSPDHPG